MSEVVVVRVVMCETLRVVLCETLLQTEARSLL